MTSRDFAYWLMGVFEVVDPKELNEKQTLMIKKHLALVFKHEIDLSMGDEKHQKELNEIHNKPTLEELCKEHNFEVISNYNPKHGEKPGPDYLYSTLHGWYHPDDGIPRC